MPVGKITSRTAMVKSFAAFVGRFAKTVDDISDSPDNR
jgi:hypothetical protein